MYCAIANNEGCAYEYFVDCYCMLYRAQKRMDGEDVFGRKITVGYPHKVLERDKKEGSPMKAQSGKKYYIFMC
jgi:hypothetical protein